MVEIEQAYKPLVAVGTDGEKSNITAPKELIL